MSEFLPAWPVLLRHEGGYVNNPNDPGGATKYGISLRWLKAQGLHDDAGNDLVVTIETIQNLKPEQAEEFYRVFWWEHYGYGRVNDQTVATKLIDTSVNLGAPRAHKFAQEAAGAIVDGILGSGSIAAINAQPALPLLRQMQTLQAAYYEKLAANNPKLQVFLAGWENRAYDRI